MLGANNNITNKIEKAAHNDKNSHNYKHSLLNKKESWNENKLKVSNYKKDIFDTNEYIYILL